MTEERNDSRKCYAQIDMHGTSDILRMLGFSLRRIPLVQNVFFECHSTCTILHSAASREQWFIFATSLHVTRHLSLITENWMNS